MIFFWTSSSFRKVAYLFNLSTCQNCQFTEEDFAAFRDILSTVQVSKR